MGLDRVIPNMRELMVNFGLNTIAISVYGIVMILDNLPSIILRTKFKWISVWVYWNIVVVISNLRHLSPYYVYLVLFWLFGYPISIYLVCLNLSVLWVRLMYISLRVRSCDPYYNRVLYLFAWPVGQTTD